MVKKRLESGEPCRKCGQTEEMLRRRGLWDRIDEVIWAIEGEPESAGMQLAAEHGVSRAPFFVVEDGGQTAVYDSALKLIKERLDRPAGGDGQAPDLAAAARALDGAEPAEILGWGLDRYGADLGIAFSGAEDVALIDMAAASGKPFSVFCLDTGRLHPETYQFIDTVRQRYGIELTIVSPDPAKLEPLVRTKGLFSFYDDGHGECCGIRKVEPLGRALTGLRAWATGQRRDQSPETRGRLAVIEEDRGHRGAGGEPLIKLNPLAGWSSDQVWDYIRDREVPYNPLHERGFRSIGCAPCTRAVLPGQHEREGRWWWERAGAKECGLHVAGEDDAA
jgi:phosphoadenosine phosphosulfate reductase